MTPPADPGRAVTLPRLTPLEIASGMVLAPSRPRRLPRLGPGATPRSAFEAAILRALRRPPCLVSFSGGRDSWPSSPSRPRSPAGTGLRCPCP